MIVACECCWCDRWIIVSVNEISDECCTHLCNVWWVFVFFWNTALHVCPVGTCLSASFLLCSIKASKHVFYFALMELFIIVWSSWSNITWRICTLLYCLFDVLDRLLVWTLAFRLDTSSVWHKKIMMNSCFINKETNLLFDVDFYIEPVVVMPVKSTADDKITCMRDFLRAPFLLRSIIMIDVCYLHCVCAK